MSFYKIFCSSYWLQNFDDTNSNEENSEKCLNLIEKQLSPKLNWDEDNELEQKYLALNSAQIALSIVWLILTQLLQTTVKVKGSLERVDKNQANISKLVDLTKNRL